MNTRWFAPALVCSLMVPSIHAAEIWYYRYAFGPEGCGCNAGYLGVHHAAVDDYDKFFDYMFPGEEEGYAAVWHEQGVAGWSGATGFYKHDIRALVADDEPKTWSDIHVWASDFFIPDTMVFGLQVFPNLEPPPDRRWFLTLEAVPAGIQNAPAVGTRWTLPSNQDLFLLELPTVRAADGHDGYRFTVKLGVLGDLTADDCVDQSDLGQVLAAFAATGDGDLTGDGLTDQADLGVLLAAYGTGCP